MRVDKQESATTSHARQRVCALALGLPLVDKGPKTYASERRRPGPNFRLDEASLRARLFDEQSLKRRCVPALLFVIPLRGLLWSSSFYR